MLEQNFQRFKDAKENWLDSLWKQPVVVCPNHTSRNDDENHGMKSPAPLRRFGSTQLSTINLTSGEEPGGSGAV